MLLLIVATVNVQTDIIEVQVVKDIHCVKHHVKLVLLVILHALLVLDLSLLIA